MTQGTALGLVLSSLAWLFDKIAGPAIVALVFTQFVSFRLERHKAHRDYVTKIADNACKDILDLRGTASAYWSRKYKSGDRAVEGTITASQSQILSAIALLQDQKGFPLHFGDDQMVELLDHLTGGKFGVVNRGADTNRAIACAQSLTKLWEAVMRGRLSHLEKLKLN